MMSQLRLSSQRIYKVKQILLIIKCISLILYLKYHYKILSSLYFICLEEQQPEVDASQGTDADGEVNNDEPKPAEPETSEPQPDGDADQEAPEQIEGTNEEQSATGEGQQIEGEGQVTEGDNAGGKQYKEI